MPTTFALIAHTLLIVMMMEVVVNKLGGSLPKAILLSEAEFVVVGAVLGLTELADV